MKILHIINTLEIGGAQSLLANIISHWGSAIDQHVVISLMPRVDNAVVFEQLDIPVEYFDLKSGKFSKKEFQSIVKFIRKTQPDVVQTWLYHSDMIGGLAARLAGNIPVIWGVHHTTTEDSAIKLTTKIVIWFLVILSRFLPEKIICCSESAYKAHLRMGYPKKKMVLIFNGVDTETFLPDQTLKLSVRQELGVRPDTRLIGMFARYHPQKDHSNFLQAAEILLKTNPDVHFILAGEGIEISNPNLQNPILQTGKQDHFHLLGKRRDMPRLQAAVDLNTLSSSSGEAFPMTICEGMACGTPCVATRVGDIAEIIGDTGMVVDRSDPQALANAWHNMLNLSETEYQSYSANSRNRILKNFEISKVVYNYNQVYQEAIANK